MGRGPLSIFPGLYSRACLTDCHSVRTLVAQHGRPISTSLVYGCFYFPYFLKVRTASPSVWLRAAASGTARFAGAQGQGRTCLVRATGCCACAGAAVPCARPGPRARAAAGGGCRAAQRSKRPAVLCEASQRSCATASTMCGNRHVRTYATCKLRPRPASGPREHQPSMIHHLH